MMLSGLGLTMLALLTMGGIALDWLLGEVRRWHPLVGFGRFANALEYRLNHGGLRYAKGALAWSLAVLPPVLLAWWLISWVARIDLLPAAVMHVVLLYFSLGLRSLRDHTSPIEHALLQGDLPHARQLTARIVSRDTGNADASDLAKAAVESLLENGNDAVFGTLFWFVVAGGPGALLFRLVNTLDAMWGYRTPRFHAFGGVAARSDDVLNWIPARLTALSYALLGDMRCAWICWRTQAAAWPSPNAGPVMAAGAGALRIVLGGHAEYGGVPENRPPLGSGRHARAADIGRAWRLVAKATALWIVMLAIAGFVLERIMHA
jgi:adenosylcobinamide-phosphate synthase